MSNLQNAHLLNTSFRQNMVLTETLNILMWQLAYTINY